MREIINYMRIPVTIPSAGTYRFRMDYTIFYRLETSLLNLIADLHDSWRMLTVPIPSSITPNVIGETGAGSDIILTGAAVGAAEIWIQISGDLSNDVSDYLTIRVDNVSLKKVS